MERWLPEVGIAYRWGKALGGLRRPKPDSPHIALRHGGFRVCAAHELSPAARVEDGRLVYDVGVTPVLDL